MIIKNKTCDACGSNDSVIRFNKGMLLCHRHYVQMQNHGKLLDTMYYKYNKYNSVVDCGEYVEIILLDRKHIETGRALVSKDKLKLVIDYKWSLKSNGYVESNQKTKRLYLHRVIMNAQGSNVVDHINHNKLDNRNENLRLCTMQQNLRNKRLLKANKTGVKGVHINRKRYVAQIRANGKTLHLGSFNNLQDAAKARREAEEKYFGEFAYKYKLPF